MTSILLALDEDKLLYTDDDNNLTLQGVLYGTKIVVDEVETDSLTVAKITVEDSGENTIVGKSVICPVDTTFDLDSNACEEDLENGSDGQTVFVETTSVTTDSHIFITPYGNNEQPVIVSEIEDEKGFTVKAKDVIENMLKFDWFVVESSK
jgi:hypothetical protein